MARIYLDHNATTPVREEVALAMTRVLREVFGNPSSTHADGAVARAELERARERVAALLGADPAELVFTAGATEANNLAIEGVARAAPRGRHLVTSSVEHPSVQEPMARLEALGFEVTRLPVDTDGLLDPDGLLRCLRDDTTLVSLLWGNNETGVVQPVEPIARALRSRGILLHLDATQCLGKLPVDLRSLPADLLSGSAHKLNGPKGAGLLFVRSSTPLEPFVRGGPQERRRRGGTENLAGAVGLGVACELARRELPERAAACSALRDRLWRGLCEKVPGVRRNGSAEAVLPNTLNVEFEGAAGDVLLQALDLEGVSVSSGAACASGSIEPSQVLASMGRTPEQASSSVRMSVGHGVDAGQIDRVLDLLPGLVARVRGGGP